LTIKKRQLASMRKPYAAAALSIDGRCVLAAASEGRHGSAMVFCKPHWQAQAITIATGPGGCMGIIPLPGSPRPKLLLIEGFFPVFQSANAGAALYCDTGKADRPWRRSGVFNLPFLHRMCLVHANGEPTVVAATLCAKKEFQDDWSHPGAVYSIRVGPDDSAWPVNDKPILEGLTKNHSMCLRRLDGREQVLVTSQEGVFAIEVPRKGEDWRCDRIIDAPTSDVFVFDIDDDGDDELLTIQPFHGDSSRIYKRCKTGWEIVWERPVCFGHVAWAGKIRGRSSVILGSRAGEKDLRLYTLEDPASWSFSETVIDAGIEPMNIAVVSEPDKDMILSANGGVDEIALYEFV